MRTLIVRFASRSRLEEALLKDQPHGGLFVETVEELELGEELRVIAMPPGVPEGIPIDGRVVWRRRPTRWRSALLPGVGVAAREDCAPRIEFLQRLASEPGIHPRRGNPRIAANLPVRIGFEGGEEPGVTENLSRGGAFVLGRVGVRPGDRITLDFSERPGGGEKGPLEGRVAWVRREPGDADAEGLGFGVEFEIGSSLQRRFVDLMVQRAEGAGAAGVPDGARRTLRG